MELKSPVILIKLFTKTIYYFNYEFVQRLYFMYLLHRPKNSETIMFITFIIFLLKILKFKRLIDT